MTLVDPSGTPVQSSPRLFFSIIIPTRNAARFTEECLKSVLCQTFPSWECLFTDDASDDNTFDVAHRLVGSDPRFRLFHTSERQTALPNLMQMIRDAKGDHILILDGDDWLVHEHVLDVIYRVYEDAPSVVATSGSYAIFWPDTQSLVSAKRGHAREVHPDEEWFQTWPFGHPLTFRRDISIASMNEEPEAYIDVTTGKPYASTYDLALFYPISARAEWSGRRIAHIPEILYAYRRHGDNDDVADPQLQALCARRIQLHWMNRMYQRERKVPL